MVVQFIVQLLPWVCGAHVAGAIGFLLWHRWRFRRGGKERTIAFFHPFCASGGGGERVLWAIIQALGEIDQEGLPIKVVIYTIDPPSDSYKADVLQKVVDRFSLKLCSSLPVSFVHLNDCAHFLEKANRLSLLVESWGTMRLAYTALVRSKGQFPTIFFDSTGCAFTYPVAKIVFGCKVIAYVHYPTISTDMLSMVGERRRVTYNNQAYIANSRFTTLIKLVYYALFAVAYGAMGSLCDLVLVNSTWTYNHIISLWWFAAVLRRIHIVFPPCGISSLVSCEKEEREQPRERIVLSIGQFRPEKDQELQIEALSILFAKHPSLKGDVKMTMVGGCRGPTDEERLQYLKGMAKRLRLENSIEYCVNEPYSVIEDWLRKASVGVHTMWNEHFGIGVVEMMSAGLITIAHDSGGPKSDIVVPLEGRPTGLLATTAEQYADAMYRAFSADVKMANEMRVRARASANRFSDEQFNTSFKQEILESRLLG